MGTKTERRWYLQRLPETINSSTPLPKRWTDLVMSFSVPKGRPSAERTYRFRHAAVAALREECQIEKNQAIERLNSTDTTTMQGRAYAAVYRQEIIYYEACLLALCTDEWPEPIGVRPIGRQ
jgi:hypothetical protein